MKHILKTIWRYKLSSGLTIASLVIAFLGIIILSLYVSFERSFDNFHKDKNDIYLFSFKGIGSGVSTPLWKTIVSQTPEIENSVIYTKWWERKIYREGGQKQDRLETDFIAVSESFFTMFNFPLVYGNAVTALKTPKTVVLSESFAKKLFGRSDVMGENVMVRDEPYRITGIMKDMPLNTIFRTEAIVSFETLLNEPEYEWVHLPNNFNFRTFYKFKKGTNTEAALAKLNSIKDVKEIVERKKKDEPDSWNVELLPLKSIHYSKEGQFSSVNTTLLNILTLLIGMLAIMGAVNFINFSTSQGPLRARSLSVQQILGKRKWKARAYSMCESAILSLIALIIAFGIYQLISLPIQNLFGIQGVTFNGRYVFFGIFVAFALIFGLLAGFYPAVYITSPPISQAIKGKMFFGHKGKKFRNALIVTQFFFTIILFIAAITIEKQLKFWNEFDTGINKENVIYFVTTEKIMQHKEAFTTELIKNPVIVNYTYTGNLPGRVRTQWGRKIDGKNVEITSWGVDDRFLDFFGIKITKGRSFSEGESDLNNFIINEKAVQEYGWQDPIGKEMKAYNGKGKIIGITKNVNFASLQNGIEPMMFWRDPENSGMNYMLLKIKTGNIKQLTQYISSTAKKFDPESKTEAKFLEESLNKLYEKEKKIARFIEFVALWTILLALTGLLGLIIFITRDKIKEIGIRKVNGAKANEIVHMLNRNIIIWLGVAFSLATPIAYYAMNKWLQNFAYKTSLSWWIFALAGIIVMSLALLTVSWQSWRAATRNPVEALRYE